MRALEEARPDWRPRARWSLEQAPLRPVLQLRERMTGKDVCAAAAAGLSKLFAALDLGTASDIKMPRDEARALLKRLASDPAKSFSAAVVTALISDVAYDEESDRLSPAPLAYPSVATSNFLRTLQATARAALPEKRSRDPSYPADAEMCLHQALFEPWRRQDRPVGLRWDPAEAKRHAYQLRAPTKDAPTCQHGANRLAIAGLSELTSAPVEARGEVGVAVTGGSGFGDRFSFAWPVWRDYASLATVVALLLHPHLTNPEELGRLGVQTVFASNRISLDKLRNFSWGRELI